MLETRTLCPYDQASILLRVHQIFGHVEAWCTARAARPERWTLRIWPHLGKYFYFTDTYFGWTAWTAISGFSYTRVCIYECIGCHQSFFIYPASRHIKPRNCCPICPSVEIIDENTFLSVLKSVQYFFIAVLAVQQQILTYKFFLNLVLTPGLLGRKPCVLPQSRCGSEFISFGKVDLNDPNAKQARSPYPLVKGPYKPLHFPRAGTTPIGCQLNALKNWVVRVVRVDVWLSKVNAHG